MTYLLLNGLIMFGQSIGSNLKFKMTEFGTLEIVSTVETEKGEVEMSTSTSQTKEDVNLQGAAKNSETSTQVSVIKTSKDGKNIIRKEGPKGTTEL